MKVGETFTIERYSSPSTGVYTLPVRLSNLAILGVDVIKEDFQRCGENEVHRYTLQLIASGKAEIQFAKYCIHDVEKTIIYEDVISFDVEKDGMENDICGGWTDYDELTDEDLKHFEEAMAGRVGVTYTPLKVSKKVVDGVKCRFVCIGRLATLGRETFPAIVEIYYPASGKKPSVETKRVLL